MKLKVGIVHLAGGREITIELDRGLSTRDHARMSGEGESRYKMALVAIERAPDQAAEIASEALDG